MDLLKIIFYAPKNAHTAGTVLSKLRSIQKSVLTVWAFLLWPL